jgi:hypothetical protein
MMHLVDKQNRGALLRARFRLLPAPLPESWKRSVGLVAGCVHCLGTKPLGYFQKQRGLSDLPRPGEELDAVWRGFAEALEEGFAAWFIGVLNL